MNRTSIVNNKRLSESKNVEAFVQKYDRQIISLQNAVKRLEQRVKILEKQNG